MIFLFMQVLYKDTNFMQMIIRWHQIESAYDLKVYFP